MTGKLLLILLFSFTGLCLSEPECGSDPCKDLWTAKSCDKVKYCIAEDWSKRKPTGATDNVCDICLRMVKEARDTLRSNETMEELKQVLEGSCKLLVLKPAVEICDKLADEFVPELVDILSSQMDPETVCAVSKLCNNEAFRNALKNSKDCIYCETLAYVANTQIQTLSSEQFKHEFLDQCQSAGAYSDACFAFGLEYSNYFFNNAKTILKNKPCEASLMCPSNWDASEHVLKLKKKPCSLCMNVMNGLRKQFLKVKSENEFNENIIAVCERLGYPSTVCSKLADPTLFNKLKQSDFSHMFCQHTFCKENHNKSLSLQPLLPANSGSFSSTGELNALELLEHMETFFPVKKEPEIKAHPTIAYGDPIENAIFFTPTIQAYRFDDCKICKKMIEVLSQSEEVEERNVKSKMYDICDKVRDVTMCKFFVENFSPILMKGYAEGFPTNMMCNDLMPSCQKRNAVEKVPLGNTCDLCVNSVRILKEADSSFMTQLLEEKCSLMPGDSSTICTLVASNALSMFQRSSENDTCNHLNLCGPSAIKLENIPLNFIAFRPEGSTCEVCEETLTSIKKFVSEEKNESVLRVILDSLCTMFPSDKFEECRRLVEIVGMEGLKKLFEEYTPQQLCSKMHICPASEVSIVPVSKKRVVEIMETEQPGKVPCRVCMMVIKTLLDQLENDKTEESIRKALNNLCHYFPEETRDTCKNIIDEYAEEIIDMIIADFNPSEICVYLKMCPSRQLLGRPDEEGFNLFDVKTNTIVDSDENKEESTVRSHPRNLKTHLLGRPDEKKFEKPKKQLLKNPEEVAFRRLRKVVQECAMCEALVGVISSHKAMQTKNYDFAGHADLICNMVPENKMKECMEMVVSYGPSVVNLLLDHKDPNDICVYIDLCDPNLQAKINRPVSVVEDEVPKEDNDCLRGPVFWCANAENAEKCGTFLHCKETVWKTWENQPTRPVRL